MKIHLSKCNRLFFYYKSINSQSEQNKYKSVTENARDVQIFFCDLGKDNVGHWICIYYTDNKKKVFVYDSLFIQSENTNKSPYWSILHDNAIKRLYPKVDLNRDVIFKQLATIQRNAIACGVYACVNIVSLILRHNPYCINEEINEDESK